MACGCQSKGRTNHVVRLNGKTVFQSTSEATALTVSKRYEGSKVVPVPSGSTVEAEERKGA